MAARKRRSPVKKKKYEFSKKLAVMVSALFILTFIVAWVAWFLTGELPVDMLTFVAAPFSVVITGYFAKAGVENYQKINNTETNQASEGGNANG